MFFSFNNTINRYNMKYLSLFSGIGGFELGIMLAYYDWQIDSKGTWWE